MGSMGSPKFIATMDEWMRDILRRVEKLERRRPPTRADPAELAQIQTLEDRVAALEDRLNQLEQP